MSYMLVSAHQVFVKVSETEVVRSVHYFPQFKPCHRYKDVTLMVCSPNQSCYIHDIELKAYKNKYYDKVYRRRVSETEIYEQNYQSVDKGSVTKLISNQCRYSTESSCHRWLVVGNKLIIASSNNPVKEYTIIGGNSNE